MNTKDFNELAVAIVNSADETIPTDVVRKIVHRALTLDQMIRDLQATLSEQKDVVENGRAAMIIALGQIQNGNVRGAWEVLNAQTQSRGHNARTEGN